MESGAALAGAAKPKKGTEIAAAAARDLAAILPRDGLFGLRRVSCFTCSQFLSFAKFCDRDAFHGRGTRVSVYCNFIFLVDANRFKSPEFATIHAFVSLSKRYRWYVQ